jgi:threonine dehydratase
VKTDDYLEKILTAKVYDVAIESPLEVAPAISRRTGNHILLKREDKQPGVLVQAARRLQQDGAPPPAEARARRDLRERGQPCAGCGSRRAAPRGPRR